MPHPRSFLLVLLAFLIASCAPRGLNRPPADPRPNIVIILADDLGYSDIGAFGSEVPTPNLDRLAENGLLMTQFYNAGRCCPTRASLLTGLYQHQAGIGSMTGNLGAPSYQGYLNQESVTMAEVLREGGYATLMTGKWHVGTAREYWPLERGFERYYGIPRGGGVYFKPFYRPGRDVVLNDSVVTVDSASYYTTDAFNDYAVDFLKEHGDDPRPFFLYVAHIAPHFPIQAPDEDIARHRGRYRDGFAAVRAARLERMRALGLVDPDVDLSPPDEAVLDWEALSEAERDSFDLRMAVYAAQIDRMDQGLGRLFDQIEAMGEWENTVIVFLSDNGGTAENLSNEPDRGGPIGSRFSYTSYQRSWANVSNTPYRMYKHWVHEGGIATPFIVHYPLQIRERRTDRQVGHVIDLMPTVLDLADLEYPETFNGHAIRPTPGRSLVPIFRNETREPHDFLFWEHHGNRAVRQGDWKLVSAYPGNRWSLYNLATDPTELHDLSADHPERVDTLIQRYAEWSVDSGVLPWDVLAHRR